MIKYHETEGESTTGMTKDEFYMGKALAEAKKAFDLGEIPIGAVIIYQKKVIAAAYNLRENLPSATAHAELLAIEKACRQLHRWRLTGCTLYVTVEPCPMCAGAIVNSRIDRVVYGCPDSKGGGCRSVFAIADSPALNHRAEITTDIRKEECAQLMKDFFRWKRKKIDN